jgi:hypothetical protein
MAAVLPILNKNRNFHQTQLNEQRQTNRQVLKEVLRRILQPLTFKQNPNTESMYYNVLWSDGNFSRRAPDLPAWPADCAEYGDTHHLERHVCFWCECPQN